MQRISPTTRLESLPATGYVRESQLIPSILPISSPTLWRWHKSGKFPSPVKLGPGVTAWKVEDVLAWMAEREAEHA